MIFYKEKLPKNETQISYFRTILITAGWNWLKELEQICWTKISKVSKSVVSKWCKSFFEKCLRFFQVKLHFVFHRCSLRNRTVRAKKRSKTQDDSDLSLAFPSAVFWPNFLIVEVVVYLTLKSATRTEKVKSMLVHQL